MLAWIGDHQTILVAVYGAVVATAVAGWNIYRSITDRGQLQVLVTRADKFVPGVGYIAKNKLWYKVTNAGRQPIYLTQIGGRYRSPKKDFLITTLYALPKKLEPGEAFDDASFDAKDLDLRRITFVGAWDSFDKVHKLTRRRLKALLRDLKGDGA